MFDHQLLLHKLGALGISGRIITWFKSYRTQRRQCVKYNNVLYDYESIKYGVPQGSVLNPALYVMYVNDLLTSLPANAVIAYADDITLTNNGSMEEEVSFNLQILLNTVHSGQQRMLSISISQNVSLCVYRHLFIRMCHQTLMWYLVPKNYYKLSTYLFSASA